MVERVGNRDVNTASEAAALLEDAQRRGGVRIRINRDGRGVFVVIRTKR